jgi:hypothetical protein
MPATPDFKAEARRIVHRFELRTDLRLHDTLREVEGDLRRLWNARGAADIAKIDLEFADGTLTLKSLDRALRSLDR